MFVIPYFCNMLEGQNMSSVRDGNILGCPGTLYFGTLYISTV